MYSILAQWDYGPTIDAVCPLIGFALLAGVVVCAIILVGQRRAKVLKPRSRAPVAGLALCSILFLAWLGFAIESYFFEPHMDETIASVVVNELPEVQGFVKDGGTAGTLRGSELLKSDIPGLSSYSAQFAVGDFGSDKNHIVRPWHIFGVNLINGRVSIWTGQGPGQGRWMPIEQWRQSSATQPIY